MLNITSSVKKVEELIGRFFQAPRLHATVKGERKVCILNITLSEARTMLRGFSCTLFISGSGLYFTEKED
jgi:hypothetical protein